MTINLSGVFAPVITTFDCVTGDVDLAAFRGNVVSHIEAGVHGIVVTGSTGEAALLDTRERGALVDAARKATPSDKVLIVGTGQESTRGCVALCKDAGARGADAVLVVAPHYYASMMTRDALSYHYNTVIDASPVPVILYNIPKYMHFALPADLVAELAQHENVIGIKDSSGNREMFAGFMTAQSDSFTVLTGNGPMFHHALMTGGRGGILAVSLFATAITLDIYNTHMAGDHTTAEALQARMTAPGAKIVGELGVAGVKAAMDRVGLVGGPVRAPLRDLDADGIAVVEELLRSAELATV